jgi:hypothetical protein
LIPDYLSHYYETAVGPFRNLSDLPSDKAEAIMDEIRSDGALFASQRSADYLEIRQDLEASVRQLFIDKGGKPIRTRPHYMILGSCRWLKDWYLEGMELRIPLANFEPGIVSFTYGDTFPAMRYEDGKAYRKQVYTLAELPELVRLYGLPQEWNPDGKRGPDRYIEAQIWADAPLQPY